MDTIAKWGTKRRVLWLTVVATAGVLIAVRMYRQVDSVGEATTGQESYDMPGTFDDIEYREDDALRLASRMLMATDSGVTSQDMIARPMTLSGWHGLKYGAPGSSMPGESAGVVYPDDVLSRAVWVVAFKVDYPLEASNFLDASGDFTSQYNTPLPFHLSNAEVVWFTWPDGFRQGYIVVDRLDGTVFEKGQVGPQTGLNVWNLLSASPPPAP